MARMERLIRKEGKQIDEHEATCVASRLATAVLPPTC